MDRSVLMAIVVAVMLVLLALLYVGWRRRQGRQKNIATPLAAPADLGSPLGTFDGRYVATTTTGDPYDRIAVHGLGFRSLVSLTVTTTGMLVQRPGSADFWVPREHIVSTRQETWTIDRVVERDGLDLVEWMLGDKHVDSYFRLDARRDFEAALGGLLVGSAS